ncbi:hypothetical protein ABU614_19300 [Lysobacter firmicutimachus]|uniref:Uncharacterized protein n=1 Tax=Lysobacter firmicutimachus TaxID=1792846 RepID=A0AAU8MR34_9GAMM
MSNYLPEQLLHIGHFTLDLYPYVSQPDPQEGSTAIQYGGDFKSSYAPLPARNKLGLVQLIFPQTKVFEQTKPNAWNVDKRAPDTGQSQFMAQCLYGSDNGRIANSKFDGPQRHLGADLCWLVDTPREFCKNIAPNLVSTATLTKFANYAVDLVTGKFVNAGMLWGYYVLPPGGAHQPYTLYVQPPQETRLRDSNEHIKAIADFLKTTADKVKSNIG